MRKLGFVALLASACLLGTGSVASATSVNLRWLGGTTSDASSITGLGTSSVTLAPSAVATLTLDIRIAVDGAGLSSAFLSLNFDTDLLNELNKVSFEELTWTGMMTMNAALPKLEPFVLGVATQESTGAQQGQFYTFDATTTSTTADCCPASTTIAFGRVVFTTNHASNGDDGPDIFSGLFNIGVDGIFNRAGANIGGVTTYGTARVNQIPEPSTLGLLGLGLSALVVAGRRRSRA